jgi:hypothetical protein
MDEFCTIFIINSLHDVKFVMNTLLVKLTQGSNHEIIILLQLELE